MYTAIPEIPTVGRRVVVGQRFLLLAEGAQSQVRVPQLPWIRQGVKLIDTISTDIVHLSERWNYFSICFG